MSEDTQNTNVGAEVDPLSVAAAGWEGRKFPLLPADRLINFKITSSKKTESKNHKPMLEVIFATVDDQPDRDGGTLRSGYKVYKRITLEPAPAKKEGGKGRTWDGIKDDLLELLSWCGLKDKTARDLVNSPSMIEGFVGMGKTRVREEEGDFPASNDIKLVLPA